MALVNKIIPFSCIDGPGNRTAIFFQGCNLKCKYCHNPETINKCTSCGACVETCPTKALEMKDDKVVWDKKKCVECDACIKTCKNLSSPRTTEYSVEDLFQEIKKVSPFIQGITVSGGECTLNSDFLVQLFKKVKEELKLTCFVDTNGTLDLEKHKELVDITDKFMLDVKSIDNNEHLLLTGASNKTVLKNLNYLLDRDKIHEVRTVVAPNLNNEKTIKEVAKIIDNRCKFKLNAYRKYGVRKEGIDFHGEASPTKDEMEIYEGYTIV